MTNDALKFSLWIFAPVLVLLLLPTLILLPVGLIGLLLALMDDSTSLMSALQFGIWCLGPVLFGTLLIFAGILLYPFNQNQGADHAAKTLFWGVFTLALYLVLWFNLTLLGSISASDKALPEYLKTTALMAGPLTLFGQVGVLPWLRFVHKNHSERIRFGKEASSWSPKS